MMDLCWQINQKTFIRKWLFYQNVHKYPAFFLQNHMFIAGKPCMALVLWFVMHVVYLCWSLG